MLFSALPALALALVQAAPGGGTVVPASNAGLVAVEVRGGDESDQLFARRAIGAKPGTLFGEADLQDALAAVRATDRFRKVEGWLEARPSGPTLRVNLDPWPALTELIFIGKSPLPTRKVLFPELRKGVRPGQFRLERWMAQATQRIQGAGYPKASIVFRRENGDSRLVVEILLGSPSVIRTCRLDGELDGYSREKILSVAGIVPGRTLWTPELQRQVANPLRKRFVKDKRLEGRVDDSSWNEEGGEFAFRVHVGPKVEVNFEGDWKWSWKNRKTFIPITRAASYNPELLDEGDRGFLRYLRGMGYLDAKVSHRRDEVLGDDGKPVLVRITYSIHPGVQVFISQVRFQTAGDIPEKTLLKVADPPSSWFGLGNPVARPDAMDAMEDRLKDYYLGLGYADISLRRLPMERQGEKAAVGFAIQERQKQMLSSLVLDLPDDPAWDPWIYADSLALVLADHPLLTGPAKGPIRHLRSDRRGLEFRRAAIECKVDPSRPGTIRLVLTPDAPLPLVRNDLALVLAAVRNRTNALGIQRPTPRIQLDGEDTVVARIEVPEQSRTDVHRLVVQGSDRTQARAVFRETGLETGLPMAPEQLYKAQANLGNLNVFRTLDVKSNMAEAGPEAQGRTWKEGDLLFQAQERAPWIVTSSFGYDKSQGYHIGTGIERLNLGGMGRTMDLGIRAGNATIQNPTLLKWFPTGDYDRSVDMFSVGYTDPNFCPGSLDGILPDRTHLRAEAAYIEEHQDVYLLRRRRVTADLEWLVGTNVSFATGYRFERAEVRPSIGWIDPKELSDLSRNPDRSIVSAPYVQIVRDTRDSPLDPTRGSFSSAKVEFSISALGASPNSSFAKLDARQQWHWPMGGARAQAGIVTFGLRIGAAYTLGQSAQNMPLSERFFAGGPTTHRGVEPDALGPFEYITLRDTKWPHDAIKDQWKDIPVGGQGMVLASLVYRFPLIGQVLWGEVFADSGQVYEYLNNPAAPPEPDPSKPKPPDKEGRDMSAYPPFRTAMGLGLISKIGGIPIKVEYAADVRRIFGLPRTKHERDTQLRGVLISAGFQF